ncbi:hypothetical protein ACFQ3A_41310, partial [Sphaerisporangium aureirubrum]
GGPLAERQRPRAALLHAEAVFTASRGNAAAPLLLDAARQLDRLDPAPARDTYLQAFSAAMFAGRLAARDGGPRDVAAAVHAAPPGPGQARDPLLDGLAALFTAGAGAAAPALRRAVAVFLGNGVPAGEQPRRLWLASTAAMALWDGDAWRALADRHVALARDSGALAEMPLALNARVTVHLLEGEFDEAASLSAELRSITAATGLRITDHGALAIAAWRGREAEAEELTRTGSSEAASRGEGSGMTVADWTRAVLYNGLGRYDRARAAALRAVAAAPAPVTASQWAPAEL